MNWFLWTNRTIGRWVMLGGLVLLCGCGTLLVHVGEISDDHVAYLVKGALGQINAQENIARRLADHELVLRLNATKVTDDTRDLGLWQARLETLELPISIETDRIDRAAELRNVSDRNRVTIYAKTHPEKLSLAGALYSEEWKQSLAQAKERVEKLTTERKRFIKQADAAASARDYLKALMALVGALKITPGDKDLVNRCRQVAADGWKAAKDAMEKNVINKAQALLSEPAVTTQRLSGFEKNALMQQETMFHFIHVVTAIPGDKTLFAEDRRQEAEALLQRVGVILGNVWAKYTAVLVDRSDFWAAYKYLAARIESTQTQPTLKKINLTAKAKSLYADQLVDGMTHFIDAASAAYNRDQYGLSYVCCLMAEEMYDFAGAQQIPITDDAATRLDFARNIEKDDVEKIAAQHNRRLIILDFLPAVTEEGGQIAYQGRTLCNKKYALPNSLTWRLSVPQGKTLTLNMVEPIDPADTIISGEIKEITINVAPVREYDQQFVEVGSDNIAEVVNPMYKIREHQPRTVWQQEVAKFYRVKREHRKEGVMSLLLYAERPGQPPTTLLTLNEKFPSVVLPLTNLSMKCEEVSFANPIAGTPRTAALKEDLVPDPYPQSVPVRLSSDKEITKAVLDFALSKIDTAIENLVVQYPMRKLAEPAVTAQKSGDHASCAEQWGQFLLYSRQLTESTLSDTDRENMSWTTLRSRLEKNLADWSARRWSVYNTAVLKGVSNLWTNATREALLARDEGTGD